MAREAGSGTAGAASAVAIVSETLRTAPSDAGKPPQLSQAETSSLVMNDPAVSFQKFEASPPKNSTLPEEAAKLKMSSVAVADNRFPKKFTVAKG